MNGQLQAIAKELYERDGLAGIQDLLVKVQLLSDEYAKLDATHQQQKTKINNNAATMAPTKRPSVHAIQQTLHTFDWSSLKNPDKNKGMRGQMLELALGIPNSSALTDLIDGELKTFTVGESIACTQLLHCLPEIVGGVSFIESKLGRKMSQTIYVGFSKNNDYKGSITLNKNTHPEHYIQLEEDYNFISSMIVGALQNKSELTTITGPNKLLQIRTKASKGKKGCYKPLIYNTHMLKNKGMAFYLCSQFGKHILSHTS